VREINFRQSGSTKTRQGLAQRRASNHSHFTGSSCLSIGPRSCPECFLLASLSSIYLIELYPVSQFMAETRGFADEHQRTRVMGIRGKKPGL